MRVCITLQGLGCDLVKDEQLIHQPPAVLVTADEDGMLERKRLASERPHMVKRGVLGVQPQSSMRAQSASGQDEKEDCWEESARLGGNTGGRAWRQQSRADASRVAQATPSSRSSQTQHKIGDEAGEDPLFKRRHLTGPASLRVSFKVCATKPFPFPFCCTWIIPGSVARLCEHNGKDTPWHVERPKNLRKEWRKAYRKMHSITFVSFHISHIKLAAMRAC